MDELERTQWLLGRKQGIGGSDIGAIMGVSHYSTAVDIYYDKISNNIDMSQSIAQRRGHYLEHFIADLYAEETGHIVIPNGDVSYTHPIETFMRVTPDYWFTKPYDEDSDRQYLLELKSAVGKGSIKWYDGVPEYIKLQCQHQMFVCCQNTMDLACLIDDQFSYLTYDRDEELIKTMVSVASDFWFNHVLAEKPPTPQTISDYKQVYRNAVAGSTIECSQELLNVIAELFECRELEKYQDELHKLTKLRIDELDLRVREYIRDYETLVYDNEIIATYKNSKNGQRRLTYKIKNIWDFCKG